MYPWKYDDDGNDDVIAGRQIGHVKNWNNNEFHEWNFKSTM